MFKNELSIKASEVYNVASRVASIETKKAEVEASRQIASMEAKQTFDSNENALKVQQLRVDFVNQFMSLCKEESNPYKVDMAYYGMLRDESNLYWSFVKLDHKNTPSEVIKKQIAMHRHESVYFDNKYDFASFDANYYEQKREKELAYRLKYDQLLQACYSEVDLHLEEESYESFLKKCQADYANLKEKAEANLAIFLPTFTSILQTIYEASKKDEVKNKIQEGNLVCLHTIENIRDNSIEIANAKASLQVLNQQKKENLNVEEEIKEVTQTIHEKTAENRRLQTTLKENQKQVSDYYKALKKEEKVNVDFTSFALEESQLALANNVLNAYGLPQKQITRKVLSLVKEYMASFLPSFDEYLEAKYEEYKKARKAFQEVNGKTLSGEALKAYSNEDAYIEYICRESDATLASEKQELEENHKKALAQIEVNRRENIAKVYADKATRKQEYIEQKKNAKIAMKMADSKKATDLKEVTKVYKKAINIGVSSKVSDAKKKANRQIVEENASYNLQLTKVVKPAPIYEKCCFERDSAKEEVNYKKQRAALNKKLSKDYQLSRYRKNMNTEKRENTLGYLFLAIWGIGLLALTLIPIIYTILMSFSNVIYNAGYSKVITFSFQEGLKFPSWTGKDNFEALFLTDVDFIYRYIPQFFRSLLFYLPIVVFIAFILALLLNTKIRGRTIFRVIYFLPVVIISGPVLSMLNNQNSSGGSSIRLTLDGSSIATILESISPKMLEYANEIFQNFVIILWMTGVPIVLFISALQKINRSLYEAADIDGANSWQKLWTITFPLIKSVLLIVCLFTIMQITTINVSYVNPINGWLSTRIQSGLNYGITALGAWAQTLVVLVFVLACFLLFREKEFVVKQKSFAEMEDYKRRKTARNAKFSRFFHVADMKKFASKVASPFTMAAAARKRKKESKGGK